MRLTFSAHSDPFVETMMNDVRRAFLLKFRRGTIESTGAVIAGEDFTVVKGTAGIYSVLFTPPMDSTPSITASADGVGGADIIVEPDTITASGCNFTALVVSAGLGDRRFNFIAMC